jgi:C4-type Zn-finger protein
MMTLSEAFHAHCPICGNHELKRISADYVPGPTAFIWRLLHIPAYRCEPCRHKYFSILPLQEQPGREREPETEEEDENESVPLSAAK